MTHRDPATSLISSLGTAQWQGFVYNINNLTGSKQQMGTFKMVTLYFWNWPLWFLAIIFSHKICRLSNNGHTNKNYLTFHKASKDFFEEQNVDNVLGNIRTFFTFQSIKCVNIKMIKQLTSNTSYFIVCEATCFGPYVTIMRPSCESSQ